MLILLKKNLSMSTTEKLNSLENQITNLIASQNEFTTRALTLLSLSVKSIYSLSEAALFLNLEEKYLYQLKFHGKLKAHKKPNQKKLYFLKKDLEEYLISQSTEDQESIEDFENEIKSNWQK